MGPTAKTKHSQYKLHVVSLAAAAHIYIFLEQGL